MKEITFEYKDLYSKGKWNRQCCIVRSVEECIKLYGLGGDVEYRILKVEDIQMKYVGSKNRLAKDLAPIIQSYIDDNHITHYWEPFVGGGQYD